MVDTRLSSSWYQVARYKPRLRDHVSLHRRNDEQQVWYVLYDHSSDRSFRLTPASHFIITSMDGELSMDDIWHKVSETYGDDTPTQDEILDLFGKLHQADILQSDVSPDTEEMTERGMQLRSKKLKQYLLNPLSVRMPLYNPDRFLNKTSPFMNRLFSRKCFAIWLVTVLIAAVLAMLNLPELVNATRLHTFSKQNILLMALVYPFMKLVHEFGHAYAVKRWGGEVNEMGITLLLFVPIPYVNASSATTFQQRHQRITVSAIGIMVELFLASIALLVWLNISSGLLSAICLDMVLIGSISTILFNGNPLLKYDAYYALSDWLAIPNLANRSKQYLGYLVYRYIFGFMERQAPTENRREGYWFVSYGIAAFLYRLFILLFILDLIIDKFFIVGMVLAMWVIIMQVIFPLIRQVENLRSSANLSHNKSRVYVVAGSALSIAFLLLVIIPLPNSSVTEGIIWLPEELQVRAKASGFVKNVLVQPNLKVKRGDALIVTEDPLLASRVKILQARLRELQVAHTARRREHLKAAKLKQDIEQARAELQLAKYQLNNLVLRSPADGKLIIPDYRDLPGRYVKQGELIGFVVQSDTMVTRIIIPEDKIALFDKKLSKVKVRPLSQPDVTMNATYKRTIPEAVAHLPSAALGLQGGGQVLVDPSDPSGTKTMEKVFQVELALPPSERTFYIGSRVHVYIRHDKQPLLQQWSRSLKQLFLKRINV